MPREEDTDSDGEIGVLCCGKRFRYSKKETVVGKEEKHREFKESDPCTVLQITPYEKGKGKKGILSTIQKKKEVHLRS
jgi:hypothetical protein